MSSVAENILKTTPSDRKNFPSTNQAHYCWQKYNEFVLCLKKNDGGEDACKVNRQLARSICVDEWVNVWDEERVNGKFLGVQEHDEEPLKAHH